MNFLHFMPNRSIQNDLRDTKTEIISKEMRSCLEGDCLLELSLFDEACSIFLISRNKWYIYTYLTKRGVVIARAEPLVPFR